MDHSNLIGGNVAARLASTAPVVWGVHHSNHIAALTKRSTLLTLRACAMVSGRVPARIVYCSEHSRTLYNQRGFAADKAVVIPNGFDTSRFKPDAAASAADVRKELWSRAPIRRWSAWWRDTILLKDHSTFLRAAAIVQQRRPDVHFLMCGTRVDGGNTAIVSQCAGPGTGETSASAGPAPRCSAHSCRARSAYVVIDQRSFSADGGRGDVQRLSAVRGDRRGRFGLDGIGNCGRIVPPSDPAALAAALG